MRALGNIGFQFILACSLLICITCNRNDQSSLNSNQASQESVLIEQKDKEFVTKQIAATTQLIELAEIGERKGNVTTSSRASALKDNQVAVLYYWIDYASGKNMVLPPVHPDPSANELYTQSENFNWEWNKVVDQKTKTVISSLTNYSVSENKEISFTIRNVLDLQKDNPAQQLVAGN